MNFNKWNEYANEAQCNITTDKHFMYFNFILDYNMPPHYDLYKFRTVKIPKHKFKKNPCDYITKWLLDNKPDCKYVKMCTDIYEDI